MTDDELSDQQWRRLVWLSTRRRERRPLSALPFDLLERVITGLLSLLERGMARLVQAGMERLKRRWDGRRRR
jgi:hypothetical protein